MGMFLRRAVVVVVTSCGALTALSGMQPRPAFRAVLQLPVPADHVKAVVLRSDSTVFLATTASVTGPSEVQLLSRDGNVLWKKALPSRVFAGEVRHARGLVLEQGADETVYYATVLDLADGAVIRRFRVDGDRVATLTAKGDALVTYSEPLQASGRAFAARAVDGDRSLELTAREDIASVHGADMDRLFVIHQDGTLDGFVNGGRRWTTEVGLEGGLSPLRVTPDGKFIVVSTPGGGFAVVRSRDGSPTLRYDPRGGEAAVDRLGLRDLLEASADKRRQLGISARSVAANLKPVVTDSGVIRLVDDSLNVLDDAAILNPTSGRAVPDRQGRQIRQYLADSQFIRAQDTRAIGGMERVQVSASGDVAVTVLSDRVLLVARGTR